MTTYSAETRAYFDNWLDQLLVSVHPLMAESFYFAAIPHFYDADLFAAVRNIDDGRSPTIVERLHAYAFVEELDHADRDHFQLTEPERRQINDYCIRSRRELYRDYHQRALDHIRTHPDRNSAVQANEILYHTLIVDPREGINLLSTLYRNYLTNRQLTAIDHLLTTVAEAEYYIRKLDDDDDDAVTFLGDMLTYMEARVAQVRHDWDHSELLAQRLIARPESPLYPYALRLLGYIAHDQERYSDAIGHFSAAIEAFDEPNARPVDDANHNVDRAETKLDLGDANARLADTAAGIQNVPSGRLGGLLLLRQLAQLVLSLPLVAYLSRKFGRKVWHPRFWPVLEQLDWVVARFFIEGKEQYEQADSVLDFAGEGEMSTLAEERLAGLYLQLGDAKLSEESYRALLNDDATMGAYRRAAAQLGRARALQALDEHATARAEAESALPDMLRFGDLFGAAQAHDIIGDAWLVDGDIDEASASFGQALDLYSRLNRNADAAQVYDKLADLEAGPTAPPVELRYPLRYRNWLTRMFRRWSSIVLLAGVLPVALVTIRLAAPRVPVFEFQAVPLLFEGEDRVQISAVGGDAGSAPAPPSEGEDDSAEKETDTIALPPAELGDVSNQSASSAERLEAQVRDDIATELAQPPSVGSGDVQQGLRTIDFETFTQPRARLTLALSILGSYILASTAIGMYVLYKSKPEDLDLTTGRKVVCINDSVMRIGIDDPLVAIDVDDVTEIIYANETIWDDEVYDASESRTILRTPTDTLFIQGTAANYRRLVRRVETMLPASVKRIDYNISWFRSGMGALFVLASVLITLLAFWSILSNNLPFIDGSAITTPFFFGYTLSDLHVYILLGFLLPPLLWFVIHPLRVRRYMPLHIRLDDKRPYLFAALGVLLALFAGVSNLSNFLNITPDVIRPIAAIGLLATSGWALFRDLPHLTETRRLGTVATIAACVIGSMWMTTHLAREASAFHFGIQGDRHQSLAQELAPEQREQALWAALRDYDRAIALGGVWLPWQEQRTASADIHISRAVVNLQLAQMLPLERTELEAAANNDFDIAIGLDDEQTQFRLWRGFFLHAQNRVVEARGAYQAYLDGTEDSGELSIELGRIKAHTGLGWLDIADRNYAAAASQFAAAEALIASNENDVPESGVWTSAVSDVYFGRGYASYFENEYEAALSAFESANETVPNQPITLDSLGTVHWKLGAEQADCSDYETATGYLDAAVAGGGTDPIAALSSRTNGRVLFLMARRQTCWDGPTATAAVAAAGDSFCVTDAPSESSQRQTALYEASADSMADVIALTPDNAGAHNLHARLIYAAWSVCEARGAQTRERLVTEALASAETAVTLDPASDAFLEWRDVIYEESTSGSLQRGDRLMGQAQFEGAQAYYELVANNTDDERAPFRVALALAAQGEIDAARAAYEAALANSAEDRTVVEAFEQLNTLQTFLNSTAFEDKIDLSSLQALFGQSDTDMSLPSDPAEAFRLAFEALDQGQDDVAVTLLSRGLVVLKTSEWRVLQTMAINLDARPDKQPLQDALRERWSQLTELANQPDEHNVVAARTLALVALTLDDGEQAGWWYQMALVRALDRPKSYSSEVRPFRRGLRTHWANNGTADVDLLLRGLATSGETLLQQRPELADNGLFWRWRAWLQYHMGWAAFLANDNDEALATRFLRAAQPDADRALALGSPGNDRVDTYLSEGALGWFYTVAGNEAFESKQFELAQSLYEKSAESYAPSRNALAYDEAVDAAFMAGLAALHAGDDLVAVTWYRLALEQATRWQNFEAIDVARERLSSAELPTPTDERDAILKWLLPNN